MNRRIYIIISLLTVLFAACAGNPEPQFEEMDGMRWTRMDCERLPDMNVARHCHVLLNLNGEFTAIGGHTGGFVITRSAEYYKDGQWHPLSPFYTHDDPFCALLADGRVLLGGGYERISASDRPGVLRFMTLPRTSSLTCLSWTRSGRMPTP